jgi:hypothetical protein
MYWIKPDPEIEKRYHEAMDRVYKLWKIRDALPKEEHGHPTREEMMNFGNGEAPANASERYRQAQRVSHEAYEAAQAIQQNYFRLNIFAMGHYVDVMLELDMVVAMAERETYPQAPWKDEPNGSEIWDTYYEWESGQFVEGDVAERWKFAEHAHDLQTYLTGPSDPKNRIPTYKFGTNDGWIVTPDECRAAVERARSYTDDEVRAAFSAVHRNATVERLNEALSYWHKWIKFIEGAAEHEGFEVR